jgi:hypothetical protein
MQYTEGQKAEIRALFAIKRRRQHLISLPLIALIMGFAFLENGNARAILGIPASMVLPGFLSILAGAIVVSLYNLALPGVQKVPRETEEPEILQQVRSGAAITHGALEPVDHRGEDAGAESVVDVDDGHRGCAGV